MDLAIVKLEGRQTQIMKMGVQRPSFRNILGKLERKKSKPVWLVIEVRERIRSRFVVRAKSVDFIQSVIGSLERVFKIE